MLISLVLHFSFCTGNGGIFSQCFWCLVSTYMYILQGKEFQHSIHYILRTTGCVVFTHTKYHQIHSRFPCTILLFARGILSSLLTCQRRLQAQQ